MEVGARCTTEAPHLSLRYRAETTKPRFGCHQAEDLFSKLAAYAGASTPDPLFDQVGPLLLDRMICGDDNLFWLEGGAEEDTATLPDEETDITPRRYGGGKGNGSERNPNDSYEGGSERTAKARRG